MLTPTLDGEETSYFEWLGAGALEVRDVGGAMHQTTRRSSVLTLVQFGFSRTRDRLFVRLDSDRRLSDLLADGYGFVLKFLEPAGVRFMIGTAAGRVSGRFSAREAGSDEWIEREAAGAAVASGTIIEAALPLDALGAGASGRLAFFAIVIGPDGLEIESHPAHHPIEAVVPDDLFEARHWTA
jgi:hypothetical protein